MASTINVGVLRALFTADTAQFTTGVRRAGAELKTFQSSAKTSADQIASGMSAAGKAASSSLGLIAQQSTIAAKAGAVLKSTFAQTFAGFGAVSLAVGAISFMKNLGTQAVEMSGHLVDLRTKTGLALGTLQEMTHVGAQTGVALDSMTEASFRLGVRLSGGSGSVRDAVKALGLEWQKLQQMTASQRWDAVVDALSQVADVTKRNELGVLLMGKSFSSVAAAMNRDYRQMANEATKATDAQIEALDSLADKGSAAMTRLGIKIMAVFGAIAEKNDVFNQIASDVRNGTLKIADAETEMDKRLAMGLLSFRRTDIALTDHIETQQSYVAQLALVRAELANLTPAQHKEIAAARELGGDALEKLEDQYGLTDGALRMFIASTKKSGSGMSDAAKDAIHLAEEMEKLRMRFAGGDAIQDVQKLMQAFGNTIPFATMTVESQRAVANVLYDGKAAWEAQGKAVPRSVQAQIDAVEKMRIIPDVLKDIAKFTRELGAEQSKLFRQQQAEQAADTGTRMLEAARAAEESRRSTSAAIEDIEFRRAESVIDMARRQGVAWQQVYAMERDLAQRRLQATLRDLELEHKARVAAIDQSTPAGKAAAAQMEADHRAHVGVIVDDFTWGEEQKRRELQRTHNFWLNLIEQTKQNLARLRDDAIRNLSHTLFGLGHDPDGSLKKAAKEAREAYEELTGAGAEQLGKVAQAEQKLADAQKAYDAAKARRASAEELQGLSKQLAQARITFQQISKEGTGSAKEIQDAFDRMREAEEAANTSFGKRFVDLWKNNIKPSLFRVFDDILAVFTRRFLDGLVNAIMGKQGAMSKAFAGLFGGGSSGMGILPGEPSIGIGGNPLGSLIGKGLGKLFGIGGSSGTASIVAGGVPAVAGTGAAGGVGIAATGGAGAAGAGGLGSTLTGLATNPFTIAAAGGIALSLAIIKKGLFRGGWEGIKGNERRDQHLAQWGPAGTGEGSGFANLASFLTSKTGESGGGSIFKDFLSGDKQRFESAQASIVSLAKQAGKTVKSFSLGGFVPPGVIQPAMLHGGSHGEMVVPMDTAMSSRPAVVNFNVHIDGVIDAGSVRHVFDTHMPNWIRMANILNTGGINDSLKVGVAR